MRRSRCATSTRYYGDSHVLHGVSFALGEGRLLGLLGRNGAGKTTCMSVTIGLLPPRRGRSRSTARAVTGRTPEAIAAHGVALVPQGRRIFRSLTVRENLLVARPQAARRARRAWTLERVYELFPRLSERAQQIAGSLSGGEQQMLAIGRALMSNPRVLLMDEPSEGLAPQIVAEVMSHHPRLKEQGLSIVLVEQNARARLRRRRRHRHPQQRRGRLRGIGGRPPRPGGRSPPALGNLLI